MWSVIIDVRSFLFVFFLISIVVFVIYLLVTFFLFACCELTESMKNINQRYLYCIFLGLGSTHYLGINAVFSLRI